MCIKWAVTHVMRAAVGCAIYTYPGGIAKDAELAYNEPRIGKRWGVPYMGDPQNGWFITVNPIQTDDSGVPQFQDTSR